MKKLILLFLLIPSLLFAQDWQEARMNLGIVGGVTPSGVTYGCPTCDTDLRCEDNASSTVVTNDGTGADWVASVNTDTITSTEYVEGSRSFLIDASLDRIYSGSNWTSEKFEVTFYMKLVSADAPGTATVIFTLGSGAYLPTPLSTINRIVLYRNTANTLRLGMSGNGGTTYTWNSTNWTVDTNWHKYTLTVDASTAPWTSVVMLQDTTTLTWDISDLPTAAAAFGTLMNFGCSTADRDIDAYFDVITVKDNT